MADLIIRGIEMPETCFKCPFMFARSYCSANLKIEFNDENYSELFGRHKDCPLLPLPAGHGRLVDAEAFNDYMQNRYDNNEITSGDWIDFRLSLKDQPTIVPAEGGGEDDKTDAD